MKSIEDAILDTKSFLASKQIIPEILTGPKATMRAIDRLQMKCGVTLPVDFIAFYMEIGDGYTFRWDGPNDVMGCFCLPNLEKLANDLNDWQCFVRSYADNPREVEKCAGKAHCEKAIKIWQSMKHWVPFWDEGNGDHFCLDTMFGTVVYDQHDWYDGFGIIANTNGILAGQTFSNFVVNWSQFCFLPTKSLFWGGFEKFGAIKWNPEYFDYKYYRLK